MKVKYTILILVFGIISLPVLSQKEIPDKKGFNKKVPDLITDRPDQTESSCSVRKNALQIETGFVYENFKRDDVKFDNWGIATTLLRYGVLDNFELRLGSYYQLSNVHSEIQKFKKQTQLSRVLDLLW